VEILELDDREACCAVWQSIVPQEHLFDLWEVRDCFARHYARPLRFLVAYDQGTPRGLLALAGTDDADGWGCFPGETWHGKTWLERNRIIADSPEVCRALLDRCPPNTHLRYLSSMPPGGGEWEIDEVGYLFRPADWEYSVERYRAAFSSKSRRRNRIETDAFIQRGLEIRRDVMDDIELMIELNLQAFGEHSYFADVRFRNGLRDLLAWLAAQKGLGVTTVLIGGKVAAVDVYAVYKNSCTVLAGGTNPEFPGVAKVINHAHIEWACTQRYAEVDFLCGDFGWKERFHLTPRPLHHYRSPLHRGDTSDVTTSGATHA